MSYQSLPTGPSLPRAQPGVPDRVGTPQRTPSLVTPPPSLPPSDPETLLPIVPVRTPVVDGDSCPTIPLPWSTGKADRHRRVPGTRAGLREVCRGGPRRPGVINNCFRKKVPFRDTNRRSVRNKISVFVASPTSTRSLVRQKTTRPLYPVPSFGPFCSTDGGGGQEQEALQSEIWFGLLPTRPSPLCQLTHTRPPPFRTHRILQTTRGGGGWGRGGVSDS